MCVCTYINIYIYIYFWVRKCATLYREGKTLRFMLNMLQEVSVEAPTLRVARTTGDSARGGACKRIALLSHTSGNFGVES